MRTIKFLMIIILIQLTNALYSAEIKLNIGTTWVFIVGILEWQDSETYGPFSKLERVDQKLVDSFKSQGVPSSQIIYIKDKQATSSNIKKSLEKMLKKTKSNDTLFVYFAGHGELSSDDKLYFVSYDANYNDLENSYWPLSSLFNSIEKNFNGSVAILTGDNCFSGHISKEAKKITSRINYMTLTSTTPDKISTANWTFTEALVDGISGESQVDTNKDNMISFSELKFHTARMMLIKEKQIITSLDLNDGKDDLILTSVAVQAQTFSISQDVNVFVQGEYYKATILKKIANLYYVHYEGYPSEDDEWVTDSQIRVAN